MASENSAKGRFQISGRHPKLEFGRERMDREDGEVKTHFDGHPEEHQRDSVLVSEEHDRVDDQYDRLLAPPLRAEHVAGAVRVRGRLERQGARQSSSHRCRPSKKWTTVRNVVGKAMKLSP